MNHTKKPYRSALSNAVWSFRGMLKTAPLSFLFMALQIPVNVFLTYAEIYLPSLVVAEVTSQSLPEQAILKVNLLILIMLAAVSARTLMQSLAQSFLVRYRFHRSTALNRKSMEIFYQLYEKKQTRDLYSRASIATQMDAGAVPISDMPAHSLKLVENVICYCMFGTVISFFSPWMLPLLTAAPLINWLCVRAFQNWEYNNREHWTDIDRKLWYIRNMPSDFTAAKDIRIYGMVQWLRRIFSDLSKARGSFSRKIVVRSFLSRIADLLVILLRDGAAYIILIRMTMKGEITADKFILYFSAISMFATCVGNMITEWNKIRAASLQICDYREYMDLPEQDETAGDKSAEDKAAEAKTAGADAAGADVQKLPSGAPQIIFDHVSFRYDGADTDTLKDISFTIHPGEKIALVGLNGAGKTTLVRLLCGLYLPTQGDIRINGVSAGKFLRRDYYRLFSPVFQDVKTAFFSLAETVSGQVGEGTDDALAEKCMRIAGLSDKLDTLPEGIHTKLDKQVNPNGTALSGGELQKLMLARALYKNAPVLVLDEPTAALDPIAESRIYQQYCDMAKGKTSLFISHRLASTRFCDRILYLKDGRITETGTHQELIDLGGDYSSLYELQSCWYRDNYKGGLQN